MIAALLAILIPLSGSKLDWKNVNREPPREVWSCSDPIAIGTNANHNGFPSITEFGGYLYVGLTEADGHAATNGVSRVLRRPVGGSTWEYVLSATNALSPNGYSNVSDLFVDQSGTLRMVEYLNGSNGISFQTRSTVNGTNWTTNTNGMSGVFAFGGTLHYAGAYYLPAYKTTSPNVCVLVSTTDFLAYSQVSVIASNANESAIWMDGNTMRVIGRHDGDTANTKHWEGYAIAPFTEWTVTTNISVAWHGPRVRFTDWGTVYASRDLYSFPYGQVYGKLNGASLSAIPFAEFSHKQGDTGYGDICVVSNVLYGVYYSGASPASGGNSGMVYFWSATRTP